MDGFEEHFLCKYKENETYQTFTVPTNYGGKLPTIVKCDIFILNTNQATLPEEILCHSLLINENFKGDLPKKITCSSCVVRTDSRIIFHEGFTCNNLTHTTKSDIIFPRGFRGFIYEGYLENIAKAHFLMFNKLDSEKEAYFI